MDTTASGRPSFDLYGPGLRLRPRQWQSQLIQLLRRRLEVPGPDGQDVLVHAGPGAGKTFGALLGFQALLREGRLSHLLVFCHRSSIAAQWRDSARSLGIELREWDPSLAPEQVQGLLLSYQSAARHRLRLQQELARFLPGQALTVADEVHHLGLDPEEPEATAWGHAFSELSRGHALRLGLSGTPFRADNLAFCAARRVPRRQDGVLIEQIEPDLSVEPRRLIVAGDVRPLEFRFQDGWVDHGHGENEAESALERSPLSLETRESWRARNLRRAIRLGDRSSIALRILLNARKRLARLRDDDHPQAGGLVIARDIAHARGLSSLLEEEGDRVRLVHSQDPESASHLQAFRAGEADWLVSIDMCAEGFDAPRLRVVAYLSTVVTRSRFLQGITRAVRVDPGRAALEPVPRRPSYVYAPADPLLMGYARSWSVADPYVIRPRTLPDAEPAAGGVPGGQLPLEALRDGAGEVIRLRGPQLPGFLDSRTA
ncbi:DEAD/DEAH box helicase [Synechococcus sp. BSF8S]|uniref:DEAD/DEAH box helicase n=1 Tax=Synechococcales TaxID=1890424 RepID=UPI0016233E56|nr:MULTISPECIES: DEAD/DEAH box helicase family protein [unclassified Synechococcus]MBC1262194.1 DEAD/DEAH box helicase [Synechococcus sp. BSF8S]MBC1265141.1 DEAD/DEAH box helicase [Synechococcus sp. BSA11S]